MTQEPHENQNNSVIIKELNTLLKPSHLNKKTHYSGRVTTDL